LQGLRRFRGDRIGGGFVVKQVTIVAADFQIDVYWLDVWRHRELIGFLAWRDLLVRYKQTVVGFAWAIVRPLAALIVYTLVFGKIARLPSGELPYTLLVVSGLLPWQLYSSVLTMVSECLVTNSALVSKIYFPRIVIAVSAVFGSLVDHVFSFALVLVLMLWFGFDLRWQMIFLPLVAIAAAVSALGVGLTMAALSARYRDFRQLIPIALQLGMIVSPVGYASRLLGDKWLPIYSLNPAVGIIDAFRWCLFGASGNIYPLSIAIGMIVTALLLWSGIIVFRHHEATFADVL
jgi:lipopolysaccharide transport system permease protein